MPICEIQKSENYRSTQLSFHKRKVRLQEGEDSLKATRLPKAELGLD